MFGLENQYIADINTILNKYSEIEETIIFGSRAMGNYKKASDVDLAIVGEKVDDNIVNEISYRLNEETFIPYFFDVIRFDKQDKSPIAEHIRKEGKIFV